ncbi:MYG1 family protein [Ramlibacter sp. USB13]|uniref:MYG1 family protein n=1 Tax=Ramlibacter cellulosilyticus TaxID=2764187 RepID=A0A923SD48_9BURK|nr:MYG1 family protein [Ramlibacter cellulosilyticus]MBC5781572.1 MYG1 family protein [Ramlibacter cellulosilyticus]
MTARIATHSGSFHADDVFGVAVLAALHPRHEIVRSRDPAVLAGAAFLVDVGGEWDAARGRFDHHQRGFDGRRPAGEGYASAGLVWHAFGEAYVRLAAQELGATLRDDAVLRVAQEVDASLVRHLDLVDTGAQMVAPGVFGLSSQVALLNSSWLEEQGLDARALARLQMERFREAMAIVQRLLHRLVTRRIGQELAAEKVRGAERLLHGRVLYLREGGMPWTAVVVQEMPDVRLVIYPETDEGGQRFVLRTVPVAADSFANRMDLPRAWAGLRDAQLVAASGVPDALFCHTNLFIAVARSFEGALRMAELALR